MRRICSSKTLYLSVRQFGSTTLSHGRHSISPAEQSGWTVQKIGGVIRLSKNVSKSCSVGPAGAVFVSSTLTETFPFAVSEIVSVSVSLNDSARDGWVGGAEAGNVGVNWKFFTWFQFGAAGSRSFSIVAEVVF